MSQRLLAIGRFAQLSGLTVRALRLYDELCLLRPDTVDPLSGYRYYSLDQLAAAGLVGRLRRYDMPLEEVRSVLAGGARREQALASHRTRLEARAAAAAAALKGVEQMMQEEPTMTVETDEFVIKTVPEQASLRISGRWQQEALGQLLPPIYEELLAAVRTQGLTLTGPAYFVCSEFDEQGFGDCEAGLVVAGGGAAGGRVSPGTLSGGEVATHVHRGPYTEVSQAYARLWSWIAAEGLEPAGEPREIYLTSPWDTPDPKDYLTEVQWPVRRPANA